MLDLTVALLKLTAPFSFLLSGTCTWHFQPPLFWPAESLLSALGLTKGMSVEGCLAGLALV